ncbi:hypothetical protein ADH76_02165 [Enterocloster clostridioformis]|uniref:UvrD-helicase domain-containing protein n=3 Tax=Enterocloster clostridioformis TaxID=1531 RepID=UPI00080C5F16|nr:hypothetical protein A4V08_02250 [Lachnoclostridium sp. YL32]OXE70285.1 hypothetical protein ADH76_02165 [Enterocloster clostridioformis]
MRSWQSMALPCWSATRGQGKTVTMLRRIQYLISQGIDPSSILKATFTEAATREMKKQFVDSYGDAPVTFCMIHSLCARIMYGAVITGLHIMDAAERRPL